MDTDLSNQNPKVSIIMPVYNGANFVSEAVNSILKQTFLNFEFIIIDDGSTDCSLLKINEFNDLRIKVVRNLSNAGLISSLNKGLSLSRGKYIARMDADDISYPNRLEEQIRFLEESPHISAVGSAVSLIDSYGKMLVNTKQNTVFVEPIFIKWHLFFGTCLIHPTVVMRRDFIDQCGGYKSDFTHYEDYELFLRTNQNYNFSNINKPLLFYRWHQTNVSNLYQKEQQSGSEIIARQYISSLVKSEIDLPLVKMVRFQSETYQCIQATQLLLRMFDIFVHTYPEARKNQTKIKINLCSKVFGLICRDKHIIRRVQCFVKLILFSPKNSMFVLRNKIQSHIKEKIVHYTNE